MHKITLEDGQSANIIDENIAQLKALFPDAFAESGVNFDVLRQLLGDSHGLEEGGERFGLNWSGKKQARQVALTSSAGTLLPCPKESLDWDGTENIFIEGDNLESLKLLQKSYSGKVKFIYIDPPYNTGKDFVYKDDFREGVKSYLSMTGQTDNGGIRTSSSTEVGGRLHSNWLSMMYPRLFVARRLLRDDGIIVISISDHEYANLFNACAEIFGEENHIGTVVWNSTKSVTNTALISVGHTYNLIFAKRKEHFVGNRHHFRLPETGDGFDNPDNDPRGPWKADPFQVGGWRPNQQYEIKNPTTGQVYKPAPGSSWKNEFEKFKELMADGRIVFGASGEAGPQRKRFLSEAEDRGKVTKTWWDDVGTTTNGTKAVKDIFDGYSVFSNPKPVDLIKRFIELCDHTGSGIVLDFFAGSGTTAHAVMELNAQSQQGSRKFIAIQLPEAIDLDDNDNAAAKEFCEKSSMKPIISELAKERLRRVGKVISETYKEKAGDTGFRVFKLADSSIKVWNPDRSDLEGTLQYHKDSVQTDRSESDVLYELLLKRGIELTAPIDIKKFGNKDIYSVGYGVIFACLADKISADEIEEVAQGILNWHKELEPETDSHVFFRDSAFSNDVAKTNMAAILEQNGISHVRSL